MDQAVVGSDPRIVEERGKRIVRKLLGYNEAREGYSATAIYSRQRDKKRLGRKGKKGPQYYLPERGEKNSIFFLPRLPGEKRAKSFGLSESKKKKTGAGGRKK